MTKEEMELVKACVLDKIVFYQKKENKEMEKILKQIFIKLGKVKWVQDERTIDRGIY